MPSLVGLTLPSAVARAANIGLHIASVEDLNQPAATAPAPQPGAASVSPPATKPAPAQASTPHTGPAAGTVIAQSPAAGHRVVKGDAVHITLNN